MGLGRTEAASLLAQRARRKVSWRFGLLPCSQNAHTQKVLVRCAQSEETKPHSLRKGLERKALATGKERVCARPGWAGEIERAVEATPVLPL